MEKRPPGVIIREFLKQKNIGYAHLARLMYGKRGENKIVQNNLWQKLNRDDISTALLQQIGAATGHDLFALLANKPRRNVVEEPETHYGLDMPEKMTIIQRELRRLETRVATLENKHNHKPQNQHT